MKTNKKRIAVSILTVFMMVFSVIPYMGAKADVAYAAEASKGTWMTPLVSNINGGLAWTQTFEADETNFFKLNAGRKNFTGSDSGGTFSIKIVDSAQNVIATGTSSGNIISDLEVKKFPKADTYTLEVYSNQNKMGGTSYYINYELGIIHVYTNKYLGELSVYPDPAEFNYIGIDVPSEYDGVDASTAVKTLYRENLKTGTFSKITDSGVWSFYDNTFKRGASYKYYLLNNNMLSAAAKSEMPADKKTEKKISAAAKAELVQWSVVTKYDVPGYVVPNTTKLKVTKKYVKGVFFEWWWNTPAGETEYWLSGFKCQTINSKGKVVATKYYKDGRFSTNKIYVPYEGTSKLKVTPYYKDKDGFMHYGKSQTIPVTSGKLQTSGSVTKLSDGKARVIAYKTSGALGTQIQYKVPNGSWKNVVAGTTKATYRTTLAKKKAGKASYRYRTYVKDKDVNGKIKTYYSAWKIYKPQKNQFIYSKSSWQYYRNKDWNDISAPFRTHWEPAKLYYNGGKIMFQYRLYNTSSYVSRTCKVKITLLDDTGKKIATKTVSNKVGASSTVTKTVKMSSKKDVNLRNAQYKISYLQR